MTTQLIIETHKVTSATYAKTVDAVGGFTEYVRRLGGIFTELIGKSDKVTTADEFRKRCDYVQGLMQIFRFCYWNGSTWWWHQNSTAESFYTTKQTKTCPTGTIEQLASGAGGRTRVTNCNYGVDTLAKKCGYNIWSCDYEKMLSAGGKKITRASDLKTGDLVHFFSGSVSKKNWKHVAVVYSTEGGKVLLADFGKRFITTGKPLHAFPSEYSGYGNNWFGVRWLNLTDDSQKEEKEEPIVKSALATYQNISPNSYGQRNHAVDTITPHCYVGKVTAKQGVDYFKNPNLQASCNYVIGTDAIGLCVPENYGSWCSSNMTNDMRAITIECASDSTAPYAFPPATYLMLINLCVDICRRYGKKKLLWLGTKEKTAAHAIKPDEMVLTVHRWFAQKACPGDWMMAKMPELAATVTAKLNPEEEIPVPKTIKIGSRGKIVRMWQEFLGGLKVDGKFGAKTKAATIAWQKKKGLTPDGVVGPKTWRAALESLK